MIKTAELPAHTFTRPTPRRPSQLRAALVAPLRATKHQSMLWVIVMAGLIAAGALVLASVVPGPKAVIMGLFMYALAAGSMWAFGLSHLLLLARDARLQSLPGVVANTTLSALVYAVLTVTLPVIAVGSAGGNMALAILVPALAAAGGLAFVLWPRWLAAGLSFLPAIYIMAHQTYHLLSPFSPAFLHWGALILAVLLISDVVAWRRLLHDGANRTGRWSTPMLLQMRQQACARSWSFDKQMLWRQPDSQHRWTNLHGIGPDTPVKAIEVALGAPFVPRTTAGNLRRLTVLVWSVLAFGVAMGLTMLGQLHDLHRLLAMVFISMGMWVGMFGLTMTLLIVYAMLKRRWEQGAEPALLALLPGLDQRAPVPSSLLRAACLKPALLCAALWAALIVCELLARLDFSALALTTLVVAGCCALTATLLLRLFAGRAPHPGIQALIAAVMFVLLCATLTTAFVVHMAKLGPPWMLVETGLMVLWLVFAGWMALLALRGWQALKARPHSFLGAAK